MKHLINSAAMLLLALFFVTNLNAQTDRNWWNSLSPEWKKVIQKHHFKGKDITPTDEQLGEVAKTVFLDIAGNKEVKTLKPAAQLSLLEVIKCDGSGVTSLEGVEGLINLRSIDCSDNDNISSLTPLSGLTNLQELKCGNTMVKNITPLRNMTSLTKLDLHYTTVVDLRILKDLKKLEYLDVSENVSLYSLEGVNFMPELRDLNCSKTNVDDLSPLSLLNKLERLDCSETRVTSLRPIQLSKNLQEISCSETEVTANSLEYLLGHTALLMIRAKNIKITDKEIAFFEGQLQKRNPKATILITPKLIK